MKKLYILIVLFLAFYNSATAQSGTEFWFAPPDVTFSHNSPGGVPIYLNISTFDDPATVTIDQPANPGFTAITVVMGANSSHQEDLSAFVASLETAPTDSILSTGLRVVATDTITAYYEVSNTNNADIFSLKGSASLGKEFYIPLHKHEAFWNHDTYSSPNLAYASFDIIATENNTTVTIYSPVDVDGIPALTPYSITLQQGETYSCGNTDTALEFFPYRGSNEPKYTIPANHPSGAVVISDKDIAITIKDDSNHNPSGGCYDLLGDQIVPVGIVGTEYIAVKGQLNPTGDESCFILATVNNTQVFIDGATTPTTTLFAGQTYRYDMDYLDASTDNSVYITTSEPAYVSHVTGFGCEQGQAILPPLGCAGSEKISIIRSTAEPFYLNIMVRDGNEGNFSVAGTGTATIDAADFQIVPGTSGMWRAAQIQFNTTEIPVNVAHSISNSSDVFTLAILNGGASTGCRYGFFSEYAAEILLDPGVDLTMCANDTILLAGTISGGTSTGEWTSSGSGQFLPDATTLNAEYVPSPADISAGIVTLTLTSTGNCTPIDDNISLNITPAPTVDAGIDVSVCSNNALVNLTGSTTIASGGIWSGGAGTYAPNNTSLVTSYNPTAGEIAGGTLNLEVTTTGNGTCNPESDIVQITFTDAPTIDAGPNQTACANNPEITLSGSVTISSGAVWSGGGGSFSPNVNALNATYTPTAGEIATGNVTLTLTSTGNNNCTAVSDVVTLSFTPAPTATAGTNLTLCENNADASLSGSVTIASGGVWSGGLGTFAPNNSSLTTTYSPTVSEIASGSVTLTLTTSGNGICNAETNNMTITYTAAPTADAGTDFSVCANNPDASLNGAITIAGGGVWLGGAGTYAPSNNSLTATYTPTAAEISTGSVLLTLQTITNGNCTAVSDDILITISQNPTVNAGPNLTVCANNADVNLGGTVTNAAGGIWSGGAGSYFSGVTDLNAVYTPTSGEISSGSFNLTLSSTGNGSCTAATDAVTISVIDSPIVNAGLPQTLCANNSDISLNGSVIGASGGVWSGGLGVFTPSNNALNAIYSPTAAEIASGTLTLTLTSTGNGSCNSESNQVTMSFTAAPTADAGLDIDVCENNPAATLSGAITIATGAVWTGGLGTFAPNNTDLNAVYTPSSNEITAGQVQLALTTTGVGNCNIEADSVLIIINPNPTVNAGIDQTICVSNLQVSLSGSVSGITNTGNWTSSGTGSFSPNATSLNATYIASAADSLNGSFTLTLSSTNNGNCLSVADDMLVTILPAGFASAGSDMTVCANNSNISLNGSISGGAVSGIWSSTGTGIFTPNDSVLTTTYIPSAFDIANGTVDLILTANSCNAGNDNITITITPAPTVDAGPDQTVCSSNLSVALAGAVGGANTTGIWTSSGSGTFSPNNTDLNATYIASSADSINLGVTLVLSATNIGNCNPVSDTVVISIFPTGIADAGNDQTLCSNNSDALLNGSITGGASQGVWTTSGTGSFIPNNTSLNATYVPSAGDISLGSVNLILSATNSCNSASDFLTITYTPGPVANAGPDLSICGTNSTVNISGSVSTASGGIWTTTGTGTISPSNTSLTISYTASTADIANGSVLLILTTTGNGNCSADVDTMTIQISTGITSNAGLDQVVCSTADYAVLNGIIANGSSSGVWSTLGTGTFAPNDSLLNVQYFLSTADVSSGLVSLVLTSINNGTCAAASDTMNITFGNSVFAGAGLDQTICETDTSVNLNGLISGGTISGQWQTLGTGTFFPNDTTLNGSYLLSNNDYTNGTVDIVLNSTNNGGCLPGSDTLTIAITPSPVVSVGSDVNICSTVDSIPVFASITNASTGLWTSSGSGTFLPDNQALNAFYIPSAFDLASNNFELLFTTTGAIFCSESSDTLTVNVVTPIIPGFNNSVACEANPIAFEDTSVIVSGFVDAWLWSFGDSDSSVSQNPIHVYSAAGIYDVTLSVLSSLGCEYTITESVEIEAGPSAAFNYLPLTPSINTVVEFADQSIDGNSFTWLFGELNDESEEQNPAYTYLLPGDYTVTQIVTNSLGCIDSTTAVLTILDNSVFPPAVPSGFSPNGDNENDELIVRGGPFKSMNLKVYNNWGNLLFESNDQAIGWDGTWKNKLLPAGDYVYTVYAELETGEIYSFSGSISILK
ncbi:MAG: PKD domain-containing protein [Crocinitomicaceae bacterium]